MCGSQCTPDKEDRVLRDEVVDFERFCLFECKPADGAKAAEQSQCVAFTEEEATKIVDKDGNPIDPAFLYSAPALSSHLSSQPPASFGVQSNLLSKGTRVTNGAEPESPDSVDKKGAEKTAKKGKASSEEEGQDARLEAARLRQMEHEKQKELHSVLKESGNGVVTLDPFAAIQDLNSAAVNARVSAEKAAVIAAQAVKEYDRGRKKIWKLALGEAGKEVLRWKKYAEKKAKDEYEARFVPTWQSKALKEAQKASKPYIEGMLRAQESVKLYNEKGFATANGASALWKQAQLEGDQANKLPRKTIAQNNLAQSDMLDAREKAKEAQQMAMEARQYFATAADVRKGIPVYQFNAQKAAAQAVAAFEAKR
jgi:hypothetical protein